MSDAKPTILVVDDDDGIRTQYRWVLSEYEVISAENRDRALQLLCDSRPSVAIVDLGLPPDPDGASEGLAVVEELLRSRPTIKVIVVTGNEAHEHALKAIASGAYDFFYKPFDPEVLKIIVERALTLHNLEEENRLLVSAMPESPSSGIVGGSVLIRKALRDAEKIARTDISVLILGESGTGKELFAHAIHSMSERSEKPFVAINCAAVPDTLFEAELFGHEKGAFTGAIKRTIGRIESANGGTLFLDEVGDIPLAMQVKLLRFLEDQIIERVGGRETIQIDVRIVCATNQNLQNLIGSGEFREDLYFRLNETRLELPPLRERDDDVVVLARYFLKRYAAAYERGLSEFAPDAIAAIKAYSWPGNVRELESHIKRAVTMSDGPRITSADLEMDVSDPGRELDLRLVRRNAERKAIETALILSGGNISRAASLLKVSRPTLYDLIQKIGIEVDVSVSGVDHDNQVSA